MGGWYGECDGQQNKVDYKENEISKEIIAESFNIVLESVEEIVTINQMYDQGKTPLDIANTLGRTGTAKYFHLHKRISEKLNISIVQVRDEVRKLRPP